MGYLVFIFSPFPFLILGFLAYVFHSEKENQSSFWVMLVVGTVHSLMVFDLLKNSGGHLVFIGLVSLISLLFSGAVLGSNWTGLIDLCLYFKYIFLVEPVEEVIERRKEIQMKREKVRDFHKQEQVITHREKEIKALLSGRAFVDTQVNRAPEDTSYRGLWEGLLGEHKRRFIQRQVRKTTVVTRNTVEEENKLGEELAKLQRTKADIIRARHALENIDSELFITDLNREADLTEASNRAEAAILRGEQERLGFEVGIADLKKKRNPKPKRESEAEKIRRSTKNKIEMLRVKSANIDEIRKAMQEDLKSVDKERESGRYTEKKRMWSDLLFEAMEK